MDKLVRLLPSHLTAVLLSSQGDEASLKYLLSGLRLLYTLCEIATRHSKLKQILLDDMKVSEQLLDLVFYLLIFCCKQEYSFSGAIPLLYSAIVPCSMYLLTTCISSQWSDLTYVLQAHPKVDKFIDAAFGAVRMNINFLQIKLSAEENEFHSNSRLGTEKAVNFCYQQCEASLQFLLSLCQNKSFRECLLRNKELCGKGGVLRLVQATLKLNISPFLKQPLAVVAAVSRLKARVLSILLHLCESESASYLDEVASIPESLELAKCVAVEVITLLKTMLRRDLKLLVNHSGITYPRGLLQLNALRLTDIFSDDSNFRSFITTYFAEVLAAILSIPYQQFLAIWCSSDLPIKEEDASLEYEPFVMAGWILDSSSTLDTINVTTYESNYIPNNNAQASYGHRRTSLLVKVISNLHCFVPNICKEQEKNLFLHKFLERLKMDWHDPQAGFTFISAPHKAATICKNLRSLLSHAESLIPTFLNEEDVQLLRVFFFRLQSLIGLVDYEVNRGLELQYSRGCTASLRGNVDFDQKTRHSNLREGNSAFPGVDSSCIINVEAIAEADGAKHDQKTRKGKSIKALAECTVETNKETHNEETSGSEKIATGGQNPNDKVGDAENITPNEHFHRSVVGGVQQDERVESVHGEERQVSKRKRNIMNDIQISLIERVLQDEPDIHKNKASLQLWANRLSSHGSEITSLQLKNWLNNRRAKLARAAKRDGSSPSGSNMFFYFGPFTWSSK